MKPFRGIFKDCNLVDQPEGTYRDAQNILYNKLKDSLCNEEGFSLIDTIENLLEYYGFIELDSTAILFYKTTGVGVSISLFGGTSLSIIARDSVNVLGLSEDNPVKGVYIINDKNEKIIVWTDGVNSPKILNITNPVVTNITSSNLNLLELFPKSNVPILSNVTVNDTGGTLLSGCYQFAACYVFEDDSTTSYFGLSNPVMINRGSSNFEYSAHVGNDSEILTSKSINLTFTNVDTSYSKLRVAVLKYSNGNYTAEIFNDFEISSNTLTFAYSTSSNSDTFTLAEIITANSSYDSAKAITYSNKGLYLANLEKTAFPDFRAKANDIVVNWFYDEAVSLTTIQNSHKDPNTLYLKGSFMPGEVYAFYMGFKLKSGGYSPLFHIPGREAKDVHKLTHVFSENSKIVDLKDLGGLEYLAIDYDIAQSIRYFHTRDVSADNGVMSFWENENEYYPIDYPDYEGQKVRHHKFPTLSSLLSFTGKDYIYESETSEVDTFEGDFINPIDFTISENFSISNITVTNNAASVVGENYKKEIIFHFEKTLYFDLVLLASFRVTGIYEDSSFIITHTDNYGNEYGTPLVNESGKFYQVALQFKNKRILDGDYIKFEFIYNDGTTLVTGGNLDCTAHTTLSSESLNSTLLGIKLSNIDIPDEIKEISDGFEIFYAKRSIENSTIAAQSLIFKHNATTKATLAEISEGEYGALHPVDLLVNDSYQSVLPSFLVGELYLTDISTNKTLSSSQSYVSLGYDVNSVKPITNAEYVPYSNQYKKETFLKVKLPDGYKYGNNRSILCNLHQYIQDIYYGTPELVSTGYYFSNDSTQTTTIYGGDMCISEFGIRILPEYNNTVGNGDFGKRETLGTFSYACFNRINAGLLKKDSANKILFYPNADITNPTIGGHYSSVWTNLITDTETPDFYDNYIVANTDFIVKNVTNNVSIYNNTIADESFPTTVISTNQINEESPVEGLRTFLPLNYYEMPKNRGEITNLESIGKTLIIHHEDGLYRTISEVRLDPSQTNVVIGSGKIFDIEPEELVASKNGFAGLINHTAGLITRAGYVFVDAKRKKIFLLSDKLEEISAFGMKNYFYDNIATTDKFALGFDEKYNRVLIANKTKEWIWSFNVENKTWTSSHDWDGTPESILSLSNELYSYYDGSLFKHNNPSSCGLYYDQNNEVESYIDFVFNESPTLNKLLQSISWSTIDASNTNSTFTNIHVLNSKQHSGNIDFNIGTNPLTNRGNLTYFKGLWNFNQFNDLVDATANPTVVEDYEGIFYNINDAKEWHAKKRFIDKYNVVRLFFDNNTNKALFLSEIDVRQRVSTM